MLTCGVAGGLLRVCTEAGIPGLQDERQQQELPLPRAAPHLRLTEGGRRLPHPTALQRRTSRESAGPPGRPRTATAGGRWRAEPGSGPALAARGEGGRPSSGLGGDAEEQAPRRRGRLIGSPGGGDWADGAGRTPAIGRRRALRAAARAGARTSVRLTASRLGLFAQLRPILGAACSYVERLTQGLWLEQWSLYLSSGVGWDTGEEPPGVWPRCPSPEASR